MKEYINDVPVFSLEEMNTSDGAYGVKESGIVRAYLKNLHKLGYLVPGIQSFLLPSRPREESTGPRTMGTAMYVLKKKAEPLCL